MPESGPVASRVREFLDSLGGWAFAMAFCEAKEAGFSDEPDSGVPGLLSELSPNLVEKWRSIRSPERRRIWVETRRAEIEVRSHLSAQGVPPDAMRLSVSHSGSWILIIGAAGPFLGVGVDLEKADRKTHPALRDRVILPEERGLPLSLLDHWVIKEACFKANPKNEGTLLPQYPIVGFDPRSGTGEVKPPASQVCRFRIFDALGWKIAVACTLPRQDGARQRI